MPSNLIRSPSQFSVSPSMAMHPHNEGKALADSSSAVSLSFGSVASTSVPLLSSLSSTLSGVTSSFVWPSCAKVSSLAEEVRFGNAKISTQLKAAAPTAILNCEDSLAPYRWNVARNEGNVAKPDTAIEMAAIPSPRSASIANKATVQMGQIPIVMKPSISLRKSTLNNPN